MHASILAQKEPGPAVKQPAPSPSSSTFKHWQWWLMVVINILFLLVGQASAMLLGRFYYDQGGNSKWLATLLQTAAFPILFIPLYLFPSPPNTAPTPTAKISLIYIALGLIIVDNLLLLPQLSEVHPDDL